MGLGIPISTWHYLKIFNKVATLLLNEKMIKRVDAEVLMSQKVHAFCDTVSELQAAQTTKRGSTFLGLFNKETGT